MVFQSCAMAKAQSTTVKLYKIPCKNCQPFDAVTSSAQKPDPLKLLRRLPTLVCIIVYRESVIVSTIRGQGLCLQRKDANHRLILCTDASDRKTSNVAEPTAVGCGRNLTGKYLYSLPHMITSNNGWISAFGNGCRAVSYLVETSLTDLQAT